MTAVVDPSPTALVPTEPPAPVQSAVLGADSLAVAHQQQTILAKIERGDYRLRAPAKTLNYNRLAVLYMLLNENKK